MLPFWPICRLQNFLSPSPVWGLTFYLQAFKIQNRISVLGQKQSADNQVERLICDQFRGCEIGKSDIAAAGGDGFGRLINTVQFRLDTGKLDGLEVKSAGIKLPDYPTPDM